MSKVPTLPDYLAELIKLPDGEDGYLLSAINGSNGRRVHAVITTKGNAMGALIQAACFQQKRLSLARTAIEVAGDDLCTAIYAAYEVAEAGDQRSGPINAALKATGAWRKAQQAMAT